MDKFTGKKPPRPDVGATGDMHKGDRARQQAPEYVRRPHVPKKDNSKKAINHYID
ncbi:MAG: hypothetical protein KA155_03925 [Alphaproteobacteria bacterium]|jgi:hypothetical protein|nr:hypothetical protein [Alphaproteobacteria bacterium]